MCSKRSSVTVHISSKRKRIDACIANLIVRLNKSGITTLASCCGHETYPMTIVALDRFGSPYEFITGKSIPRKRRFYKKDSKGFYFIPEVLRCLK